jgi:hypothetical protein
MTLGKAIENFDAERVNKLSLERKIEWISQLDNKIFSEILQDRGADAFGGYTVNTPFTVTLMAPDRYSEIYTLYLNMKLDYIMEKSVASITVPCSSIDCLRKCMMQSIVLVPFYVKPK